jgi:hypothetical protein
MTEMQSWSYLLTFLVLGKKIQICQLVLTLHQCNSNQPATSNIIGAAY